MIAKPETIREAIAACKRRLAELEHNSPDIRREQRWIEKLEQLLRSQRQERE